MAEEQSLLFIQELSAGLSACLSNSGQRSNPGQSALKATCSSASSNKCFLSCNVASEWENWPRSSNRFRICEGFLFSVFSHWNGLTSSGVTNVASLQRSCVYEAVTGGKCENQKKKVFLLLTQSSFCNLKQLRRGSMQAEGRRVQSIYYGRIGSEVTEMLLARFGQDGSFLLRDSETVAGAYCLCVRKAPFVHTFRLVPTNDGWFLQEPGGRQQIFRTLETLIEHYRRGLTSEVQVPPLTDPLDKTEIEYTSFGEDLLYMETCGSSDH